MVEADYLLQYIICSVVLDSCTILMELRLEGQALKAAR